MISPCLSNIFLHHVLDEWFEFEVRPRLKGRCTLVRFADDAVMAFEDFLDAKRVLSVLGKRLARYGLTLHPDKTRFVDFRNNRPNGTDHPETDGTSFTFLGFAHVWGKSRLGKNVVRQVTAKNRYARALAAITACCRVNRHQSIPDQHAHLTAMMRGHYAYYGITGNFRRLSWYARQVATIWQKWLSRRDRSFPKNRFSALLQRHPLRQPGSSIATPSRAKLFHEEPEAEICTSGTVRDEDGNILIYSANDRGGSRRRRHHSKPGPRLDPTRPRASAPTPPRLAALHRLGLLVAVALLRNRDDRRVHHLAAARDVSLRLQIPVEPIEQRLD